MRTSMKCQRVAAAIVALMLANFQSSSAQDQPEKKAPESEPRTVVKTTTRLVVVDVVATNAKGEPVSDLSKQDFKLLENGTEQEIRVFDFQHPVQSPAPATTTAAATPGKLPPNVF